MPAAELKCPPNAFRAFCLQQKCSLNSGTTRETLLYALKQQRIKKKKGGGGETKYKQRVKGGGGQITVAQAVRILLKTASDKNKTTSYIPIACIRW